MTTTGMHLDETSGPAGRRTFLRANAVFILFFAALVTLTAGLLSYQQPSTYTSVATVDVESQLLPSGAAPAAADMGTEKTVAMSSVVTKAVPGIPANAADDLSVTVPVDTQVLEFRYTGRVPREVARRAQAFAKAFVDYRNARSTASTKSKSKSPPAAEIISPASLPTSPSGPDHALQIGAALLLGLALGTSIAAANDRWGRHVHGPGHLAELTRSPVFAVVPRPRLSGTKRLVMTSSPRSAVAEAYRFLQMKVLDPLMPPPVSTLVVTCSSDRDREARDVVAANLAAAAAEAGRVVVIVSDTADRGALESLLGVRHLGIDIFAEAADLRPRGAETPGPDGAESRKSSRLSTDERSAGPTFEQFRQTYDVVIVHAGPLNCSVRTLMRLRQCDACLFVVDTQLSARADVQEAFREATHGSFGPVLTVLTNSCSAWRSGIGKRAERRRTRQAEESQPSSTDDSARRNTPV